MTNEQIEKFVNVWQKKSKKIIEINKNSKEDPEYSLTVILLCKIIEKAFQITEQLQKEKTELIDELRRLQAVVGEEDFLIIDNIIKGKE